MIAPTRERLEIPRTQRSQAESQLREQIVNAFRNSSYLPLRRIDVTLEQDRVLLHGTVPSYHLKQVAQSAALAVDGVHELDNQIVVVSGTENV